MRIVRTKEELKKAIKEGEHQIMVEGEYSKVLQKKLENKKKIGLAGVGIALLGIIAIPFTGGASAIPVVGLTVGTVTVTVAELALILGFGLSAIAMVKGYTHIEVTPEGIRIEKK